MKIELEREDATFSTLSGPYGSYRALMVRIGGKPFVTTRTVESFHEAHPQYAKNVDEILIKAMERILTKILEKACLEVPEGVELINPEEDAAITNRINDARNQWFERKVE